MTDAPPPRTERRPAWRNLSIVWIVPLLALAVSLFVVWRGYTDRGPLITIAFANASGVAAEETELRFRDVSVGVVEAVRFGEDLGRVLVDVRVDESVAPFVDEGAQFWVVRPEVSARGVSGLSTVISGVFIEGAWDDEAGEAERQFDGLASAPLRTAGQAGIEFTLRADDLGSLGDGSPILYRGIEVGRVANLRLAGEGSFVLADAFVSAPHDRLITSATRFWDTSGIDFSFGTQGAELNVDSLASLISGAVSFETVISGGEAVGPEQVFRLYDTEDAARNSVFNAAADGRVVNLSVLFDGDLNGLTPGAPVEFRGVRVGEVRSLTGFVDEALFGNRQARLLAVIEVNGARLGLDPDATDDEIYAFLEGAVERGLRAQLRSQNLLTGGLKVTLVQSDDEIVRPIDMDAEPFPRMPAIAGETSDVAATAEGVFDRINNLPVEELLSAATNVLNNVNLLLGDDAIRQVPSEAVGLLTDVRGVVGSDAVQALPDQAGAAMADLTQSTRTLAALLAEIEDRALITTASDTLRAIETASREAGELAEALTGTAEALPPLLAEAQNVAAEVAALPLADTIGTAQAVLSDIRALTSGPELQELPAEARTLVGNLDSASADLSELLARLAEADVAGSLATGIDEFQDAAARYGSLAVSLDTAANGLPDLVSRLTSLARTADELPLDSVLAEADALLTDLRGLTASEATQALPGRANDLVAELQSSAAGLSGLVAELQSAEVTGSIVEGVGAVERAALQIEGAAGDVGAATEGLPGLIAQLDTLAETANALPLQSLLSQTEGLAAEIRTLVGSEAAQGLPGRADAVLASLGGAADDLDALLSQARERDVATSVIDGIEAVEGAALAIESASGDIDTAVEGLPQLVTRIDALVQKANALPLETLLGETQALAAELRGLAGSEEAQALPGRADAVLASLGRSADDLQAILGEAREREVATTVVDGLEAVERAALAIEGASGDIDAAADGLPGLVARLDALAATANELPLQTLIAEAEALLGDLRAVAGTEAAQALPADARVLIGDLQGAARRLDTLLAELEERDVATTLADALDAVGAAAADIEAAAADVEAAASDVGGAAEGLPSLLAEVEAFVAEARTLPIEDVGRRAAEVLASLNVILSAEGADALPASVNDAAASLAATLTDVREAGVIANANETLLATERAATSIAAATDTLPQTLNRLSVFLGEAETVLAGYDQNASIGTAARSTLREVREAAESVNSLARTIERRPNALLLGR